MEKFILVTGGANGIGKAVTEHLAQANYKVFCADINEYAGENENVIPIIMDVTKSDSISTAIETISEITPHLTAVINCAGIFLTGSVAEIDEVSLWKIMDINLMGVFRVNKACMPLLLAKQSKIINISSDIAQYSPAPFNGPYAISKHALEAYNDALRRELMLLNIPVVKIRPGALKTKLLDGIQEDFNCLCESSEYFKNSLCKMSKMMQRELNKTNDPILLAKLVKKIIEQPKPKSLYKIVCSCQLKFLSLMSEKTQDKIYKRVLCGKS